MASASNTLSVCSLVGSPALEGKVVVNPDCGLARLTVKQFKGVTTILRNLSVQPGEEDKVWFIEIGKVFREKSLKIYFLPLGALRNIIKTGRFGKVPDPTVYLTGFTVVRSAALARSIRIEVLQHRDLNCLNNRICGIGENERMQANKQQSTQGDLQNQHQPDCTTAQGPELRQKIQEAR